MKTTNLKKMRTITRQQDNRQYIVSNIKRKNVLAQEQPRLMICGKNSNNSTSKAEKKENLMKATNNYQQCNLHKKY